MKKIAFFIGVFCIVFYLFWPIAAAANGAVFADPNGPYFGEVGTPIVFDGTDSSSSDGGPLMFF